MRADAERNRRAILAAARAVFAERGTGAPLDLVAQQAGVGQATLYRRFPTRDDLIRAVIMDIVGLIEDAIRQARGAATEQPARPAGTKPAPVWERLIRPLAELRLGLLLPMIGSELTALVETDEEVRLAAEGAVLSATELLRQAQQDGLLRSDITLVELQMLISTVSRPVPGVPPEIAARLGERLMAVVIDGLRPTAATPLPGTSVTRAEVAAAVGLPAFFAGEEAR